MLVSIQTLFLILASFLLLDSLFVIDINVYGGKQNKK